MILLLKAFVSEMLDLLVILMIGLLVVGTLKIIFLLSGKYAGAVIFGIALLIIQGKLIYDKYLILKRRPK